MEPALHGLLKLIVRGPLCDSYPLGSRPVPPMYLGFSVLIWELSDSDFSGTKGAIDEGLSPRLYEVCASQT